MILDAPAEYKFVALTWNLVLKKTRIPKTKKGLSFDSPHNFQVNNTTMVYFALDYSS
jgi:hypothetical protein